MKHRGQLLALILAAGIAFQFLPTRVSAQENPDSKKTEKPTSRPADESANKKQMQVLLEKAATEKQNSRFHDKIDKMQDQYQLSEKPERDPLEFLDNIDYPELQVVPRASERLEAEAQYEREGGSWLNQWSFFLSGTSTLAASLLTNNSIGAAASTEQQNIIKVGQMIGTATIGVGLYYAFAKPYDSVAEKMRKIKAKDKRSMLLRERTAEEALEKNANIIGNISTMSVWANLLTNVALATQGDGTSKTYAYGAIFISSLSLFFTHPYILNWQKHKEYKHKIYSPLPQTSFYKDSRTGELNTYAGLLWRF